MNALDDEAETRKSRQAGGVEIERQMIDFLVAFSPARSLKVEDIVAISKEASRLAHQLMPLPTY